MNRTGWIVAVVVAVAALGAGYYLRGALSAGSQGGAAPAAMARGAAQPPVVRVVTARPEKASPVVEYIARVEPIQQVNIMAQVEGIIQAVHFQEGSRVAKGDPLFTIDPAPYQARVAQREAELAQAQAALDRAEKYWAMLQATDGRSVSKSDLDTAEAGVAEGRARVKTAQAALTQAGIDLGYTRIESPIAGRIGRALITQGNLVSPSSGTLATIVQLDPVRVVIAMPDAEYLTEFARYSNDDGYNPIIKVRLANGLVLPSMGEIDFDDNQMNPATGTIDIRMRFPNADRMLVANNHVTALVQDGGAPMKILVPVESVMHDAEGAFVWTVADDNTVVPKRVEAGAYIGARQIIDSGLLNGDRVVVAGMQKVQPGIAVQPQEQEPAAAE